MQRYLIKRSGKRNIITRAKKMQKLEHVLKYRLTNIYWIIIYIREKIKKGGGKGGRRRVLE